jgi:hypothetical protein
MVTLHEKRLSDKIKRRANLWVGQLPSSVSSCFDRPIDKKMRRSVFIQLKGRCILRARLLQVAGVTVRHASKTGTRHPKSVV